LKWEEQAMTDLPPSDEQSSPRSSLLGRLLIAGFMGAVVVAECIFAYLWLPSSAQVAAQMEQMAKEAIVSEELKQAETSDSAVPAVEVALGRFTVTNHRLPSESTFRVEFDLWGTVAEQDQNEFATLFQRNERRFRDQVIVEIRNCEVSELEDPGLGLIKRRILAKSNALLGKPLLRSVIFADYAFVEL
jgi:hypothetical protein